MQLKCRKLSLPCSSSRLPLSSDVLDLILVDFEYDETMTMGYGCCSALSCLIFLNTMLPRKITEWYRQRCLRWIYSCRFCLRGERTTGCCSLALFTVHRMVCYCMQKEKDAAQYGTLSRTRTTVTIIMMGSLREPQYHHHHHHHQLHNILQRNTNAID